VVDQDVSFTEGLARRFNARAPGESVWVPRSELPHLPHEWAETILGTPLWIAKPGSVAQYRAWPALHAYEFVDGFDLHRDRYDPSDHPLLHMLFDAWETIVAIIAAFVAGLATWAYMNRREKEKPEGERQWWVPLLAAIGVAALAGLFVYVLGAVVRIAVAGG
jgi:hypothetical protein